jgi:hypothetical protein
MKYTLTQLFLFTYYIRFYKEMIWLLEAILTLNIEECLIISKHSFVFCLKMASKSRNMSL